MLRRRGGIELIHEEMEMKHLGLRIVKRHKTVLGIHHFLQRGVDLHQELVEFRHDVQGADHLKKYLPLNLRAFSFGNIARVDNDRVDLGLREQVGTHNLDPAPGAILGE